MSALAAENDSPSVTEEVVTIRSEYVNRYVTRRLDHRNGDATTEQIVQWENEAYRNWRARFPALSALLPSHLPSVIPSGDGAES